MYNLKTMVEQPGKHPDVPNPPIMFPHQGWVQGKNLIFVEDINRNLYDKHIANMENKIRSAGFMDSIKVFSKNSEGNHIVAEAQHRVKALQRFYGSNFDEMWFPVSVLWWVDPLDKEEVQHAIITLNIGNKNWSIYDYVRSYSEMSDTKYAHKDYKVILQNMKKYKDVLSNGIVAQIYSKNMMNHDILKEGRFIFTEESKRYSELFLSEYSDFISRVGDNNVPTLWKRYSIDELQRFIDRRKSEYEKLGEKNSDSKTFSDVRNILIRLFETAQLNIAMNKTLPMDILDVKTLVYMLTGEELPEKVKNKRKNVA